MNDVINVAGLCVGLNFRRRLFAKEKLASSLSASYRDSIKIY